MVFGLPSGLHAMFCALLLAQAEPAPPEPPKPPPPPPAPVAPPQTPAQPEYFIGLAVGGGHRLATAGEQVPPAYGMSVASLFGLQYASLPLGGLTFELGAAIHFDYQRYASDVTISLIRSGRETTYEDVRTLSYYDFAALQTVGLPLGPVRLLASAGVGLALGHFSTLEPALRPGESRMIRPLVRGSLGVDAAVGSQDGRLGLTIGASLPLFEPSFSTDTGQRLQVFGDRLSANLMYSYTF
jgi:hypothetical protein